MTIDWTREATFPLHPGTAERAATQLREAVMEYLDETRQMRGVERGQVADGVRVQFLKIADDVQASRRLAEVARDAMQVERLDRADAEDILDELGGPGVGAEATGGSGATGGSPRGGGQRGSKGNYTASEYQQWAHRQLVDMDHGWSLNELTTLVVQAASRLRDVEVTHLAGRNRAANSFVDVATEAMDETALGHDLDQRDLRDRAELLIYRGGFDFSTSETTEFIRDLPGELDSLFDELMR